MEGELDAKMAAYGKLCSAYEYGSAKGSESGMATDQVDRGCAVVGVGVMRVCLCWSREWGGGHACNLLCGRRSPGEPGELL